MSTVNILRLGTSSRLQICRIVVHAGLAYTTGLTSKQGDVATQTRQVLSDLDEQLASVGSNKSLILSAQVWLADMPRDFDAHNAVWDEWVDRENLPARACVGAELYDPDVLVEIRVIAAVPPEPA